MFLLTWSIQFQYNDFFLSYYVLLCYFCCYPLESGSFLRRDRNRVNKDDRRGGMQVGGGE